MDNPGNKGSRSNFAKKRFEREDSKKNSQQFDNEGNRERESKKSLTNKSDKISSNLNSEKASEKESKKTSSRQESRKQSSKFEAEVPLENNSSIKHKVITSESKKTIDSKRDSSKQEFEKFNLLANSNKNESKVSVNRVEPKKNTGVYENHDKPMVRESKKSLKRGMIKLESKVESEYTEESSVISYESVKTQDYQPLTIRYDSLETGDYTKRNELVSDRGFTDSRLHSGPTIPIPDEQPQLAKVGIKEGINPTVQEEVAEKPKGGKQVSVMEPSPDEIKANREWKEPENVPKAKEAIEVEEPNIPPPNIETTDGEVDLQNLIELVS